MQGRADRGFNRTWTHRAVPEAVPTLRRCVFDFASAAGVPQPPLEDVRLAVSEAVTNAVTHGYRESGEAGEVEVTVSVSPARIDVAVVDRGLGFAPRIDSPGAGLGVPLISTLADRLTIEPASPSGTAVRMRFEFAATS